MTKRTIINPYTRLKDAMRRAWSKVEYPKRVKMWKYPISGLSSSYNIKDLWDRTHAATACGYDVCLTADDDGLHVHYVEKRPSRPSDLI